MAGRIAAPVELLLQALVGVIDAELLEAVLHEAFKAVDVQDGQAGAGHLLAHGQECVDARDQPPEQRRVHRLGQRVARILRRVQPQPPLDRLPTCRHMLPTSAHNFRAPRYSPPLAILHIPGKRDWRHWRRFQSIALLLHVQGERVLLPVRSPGAMPLPVLNTSC